MVEQFFGLFFQFVSWIFLKFINLFKTNISNSLKYLKLNQEENPKLQLIEGCFLNLKIFGDKFLFFKDFFGIYLIFLLKTSICF